MALGVGVIFFSKNPYLRQFDIERSRLIRAAHLERTVLKNAKLKLTSVGSTTGSHPLNQLFLNNP